MQVLIQKVWIRAWDSAFLLSPLAVPMLLVHRPHFEQHRFMVPTLKENLLTPTFSIVHFGRQPDILTLWGTAP